MRLLQVRDLRFEEFHDGDIPPYAILSHRWSPDEVSYHDFMVGNKKDGAGWKKILECCSHVAADPQLVDMWDDYRYFTNRIPYEWSLLLYDDDWIWVDTLDWVWIDTCCIDKASSAELSEAINAMHRWYAESKICYVFLSDVTKSENIYRTLSQLRESEWFTRGWTLQELLAPRDLRLLDRNWDELGTRSDFLTDIAEITRIARERLEEYSSKEEARLGSFAEILSWAADRVTARVEDSAYCLMGLLGIQMPLLYGEHDNAFPRLQRELIGLSNDESIFAWQSSREGQTGLIAQYPFQFKPKYSTQKGEFSKISGLERPPYAITNQGLQFHVPEALSKRSSFLLPLNCRHYESGQLKGAYAILIERDVSRSTWVRSNPQYLPEHFQKDGPVCRLEGVNFRSRGLFIVRTTRVCSVDDLTQMGSKIIYVQIQ